MSIALEEFESHVSENGAGEAPEEDDLARVFAEIGSAFAADCGSRRFDLPGLPGQFIEVRVLDGGMEERLFQAGIQFAGIPGEKGASLKIDMEAVYLLACDMAITNYLFKTKAGEDVSSIRDTERKRKHFQMLHPRMKQWVKDCIAAMNPNVQWAGLEVVKKKRP